MADTSNWEGRNLPVAVQEWAEDVSDYLSELYEQAKDTSDPHKDADWEFYQREKEHVLGHDDIVWVVEGSERTVAYLGRTWDGEPLFDDRAGVVVKFQPSVKASVQPETTANRQAIKTYGEICERGDEDLVASFYCAGANGSWVAQEYAIPINPPRNDSGAPYDRIRDSPEKQLREQFEEKCRNRGLSVNVSRGNVGINREGQAVLTDIGGHTAYSSELL